jgi:hypothetical protein
LNLFLRYYAIYEEQNRKFYIEDFSERKRVLGTNLGERITIKKLRIQLT